MPFKCESSPGLTNTPWKRNISVCLIGLQHRHAPVVVHFIATVHRRCRQRAGVIIQLIIQIYGQVCVLNIAKIYTLNTFRTTYVFGQLHKFCSLDSVGVKGRLSLNSSCFKNTSHLLLRNNSHFKTLSSFPDAQK